MLKEKAEKLNLKNRLPLVKDSVKIDKIKGAAKNITKEQTELSVVIRLAIAVVLLIIANLSFMPTILGAIIKIIAFLVCAYDMLIGAVQSVMQKKFFAPAVLVSLAGVIALCVGAFTDGVLFIVFYRAFELIIKRALKWAEENTVKGLDLRAREVRLYTDDKITVVPTESVRVGDLYMVTPGDVIPLDGIVQSGASELDTEPLTGETVTRKVQKDSIVLSGCINVSGTLIVQVTADLKDSVVTKRLGYIADYDTFETKLNAQFERFSSIFVPAVLGLAVVIGVIVPIFAGDFPKWLHTAAVLIAAASPVPLFTASAITYYSQLGSAAKNGVLIRNKNTVDGLTKVGHVVFDKDGTLSTGRYTIKEMDSKRLSDSELLMLASYALANSETQIASLIRESAEKQPDKSRIKNYYEEDGKCCIVQLKDGRVIAAGNAEMLEMMELPVPEVKSGCTTLYICVGKEYAGCIHMQDKVRSDAFDAVNGLRAMNVKKISMLTIDPEENGERIAETLAIDGVYHTVNNEEREAVLEEIADTMDGSKETLVYLSHDFEDPTLFKKATIGAAMNGLVSDAAMKNADVVLVKSEPSRLCTAIRAAKNIKKTLTANFAVVGAVTLILAIIAVFDSLKLWVFALLQGTAVLATILIAIQGYDLLEKQLGDDSENE